MIKSRSYYRLVVILLALNSLDVSGQETTRHNHQPSYVFIIDVSGSMKPILRALKDAASTFVATLPDSSEVILSTFHEQSKVLFSDRLNASTRDEFRRIMSQLTAKGKWTHFAAALEALQQIRKDPLHRYVALVFTDQLSDPRPSFKDIGLDELRVGVPKNIDLFVISSPEALASIGTVDSTGFVRSDSGARGAAVDLRSSSSILERLHAIATEYDLSEALRPRRRLPIAKLIMLSVGGVLLVTTPILVQAVCRRRFVTGTQATSWSIMLESDSTGTQEFVIYPNRRLAVGSAGEIRVPSLPPVAVEFICDKSLKLKLHAETVLNGKTVTRGVVLKNGDRVDIEESVHLVVRRSNGSSNKN